MAKNELIETAKQIGARNSQLLERVKQLQTDVSASLQQAKRQESKLIEAERAAEKARVEREKAERLKEFLEAEQQKGVYVGGADEAQEPTSNAIAADADISAKESANTATSNAVERAADSTAESVVAVPEVTQAPRLEEQNPMVLAENNVQMEREGDKRETEVVKVSEKATTAAPIEEAKPIEANKPSGDAVKPKPQEQQQRDNDGRKAYDGSRSDRPYGDGQQGGQAPRNDRPYGDRQQGGQTPRSDRPYGDRQQGGQTPRSDRPYGDRQQGGQAPRSDRPYGDRQQGGQTQRRPYGDRPQGGQTTPRTDKPYGDRRPATGVSGGAQQRSRTGGTVSGTPVAPPTVPRTYDGSKGQYVRSFDNDKKQKNKKALLKESAPSVSTWDEEGGFGSRKKSKKQQMQRKPEPVRIEKAVLTTERVTVRELSEKIGKPAAEIIKKLFLMGTVATINNEIDFDICELIAADYDIALELQLAKTYEEVLAETADETDSAENLEARPPVVTIMGHVDHGKTSLLDAIRDSSITQGEAGGITQHIGAYTVACNDRLITFIDTPGHEAFTAMRARGAQVTDVVILVVAADDGIMPQTVEAINHSKAAGVPIIVAINKMDRAEANPDRVLQQLTEHGLLCEDWGGETICVPVSAKTHMNLDTLLEMVLLQADVLELKANPNRKAKGTIIESKLDKGRGPVATVLVQNGTLHVGDPIVAGVAFGKVRAMMDDKGRRVKEAGPSKPVEVLGFNEVPSAGDEMNVADIDRLSKLVAEERRNKLKAEQQKNLSRVSLEDLFSHIAEGEVKDLNIVIKADVDGSVEAVKQALEKLSKEEVRVKCIHGAVGAITASDVMFASASNAIVIGFNVRPDSGAKTLAEQEKVDVRTYRVIYQAIEDVENAMKGMFKPIYHEVQIGSISVRNTFKVSGVGVIAGAYVTDGKASRNAQVRVVRDGVVVHEGKIGSLRRFKDDVKEVAQGYECGISIDSFNDIHEGDVIEAFVMEEVKR